MASLKSEDWSIIGKMLYKYFLRGLLVKAVSSTKTDFDDKALAAVDKMLKQEKGLNAPFLFKSQLLFLSR